MEPYKRILILGQPHIKSKFGLDKMLPHSSPNKKYHYFPSNDDHAEDVGVWNTNGGEPFLDAHFYANFNLIILVCNDDEDVNLINDFKGAFGQSKNLKVVVITEKYASDLDVEQWHLFFSNPFNSLTSMIEMSPSFSSFERARVRFLDRFYDAVGELSTTLERIGDNAFNTFEETYVRNNEYEWPDMKILFEVWAAKIIMPGSSSAGEQHISTQDQAHSDFNNNTGDLSPRNTSKIPLVLQVDNTTGGKGEPKAGTSGEDPKQTSPGKSMKGKSLMGSDAHDIDVGGGSERGENLTAAGSSSQVQNPKPKKPKARKRRTAGEIGGKRAGGAGGVAKRPRSKRIRRMQGLEVTPSPEVSPELTPSPVQAERNDGQYEIPPHAENFREKAVHLEDSQAGSKYKKKAEMIVKSILSLRKGRKMIPSIEGLLTPSHDAMARYAAIDLIRGPHNVRTFQLKIKRKVRIDGFNCWYEYIGGKWEKVDKQRRRAQLLI